MMHTQVDLRVSSKATVRGFRVQYGRSNSSQEAVARAEALPDGRWGGRVLLRGLLPDSRYWVRWDWSKSQSLWSLWCSWWLVGWPRRTVLGRTILDRATGSGRSAQRAASEAFPLLLWPPLGQIINPLWCSADSWYSPLFLPVFSRTAVFSCSPYIYFYFSNYHLPPLPSPLQYSFSQKPLCDLILCCLEQFTWSFIQMPV